MRTLRLVAASVVAVLVIAGCGGSGAYDGDVAAFVAAAQVDPIEVPASDPRLAPTTWLGAAAWIARETSAGRPVVVNLFGSWCEPCRDEAPLLRAAIDANPDVTFLLVDTRDGKVLGERFLAEFGLQDVPSLFDPDSTVYEGLGGRGMPATWFFAPPGVLVSSHTGPLTPQSLDEGIASVRPSDGS